MTEESFDTSIFPDLIAPVGAAFVLTELYGAEAADAAHGSAEAALADGRHRDYGFWMTVRGMVMQAPATDTAAADDDDNALLHLPTAEELLLLIRQFARIADPETRGFAIDRVAAIAERRVVPLRGKRP